MVTNRLIFRPLKRGHWATFQPPQGSLHITAEVDRYRAIYQPDNGDSVEAVAVSKTTAVRRLFACLKWPYPGVHFESS